MATDSRTIEGLHRELETDASLQDSEISEWAANYFRENYNDEMTRLVESTCPDGMLLDVGSAPCHLTYILNERGYDVTGLDIDPSRFDAFLEAHDLDVRECDIERDPFPVADASQDIVLFGEVFEHLRINPIHALEEIHRTLKPGGHLILSTPQLFNLVSLYQYPSTGSLTSHPYEEYQKLETVGHMGHVREYTPEEVRRFLKGTGFQIVETRYTNFGADAGLSHPILGPIAHMLYRVSPSLQLKQIHIATKE